MPFSGVVLPWSVTPIGSKGVTKLTLANEYPIQVVPIQYHFLFEELDEDSFLILR